jgi:hypothetical protein
MIARVWQGVATELQADKHAAYVQQEIVPAYLKVPGNRGALMLSRIHDGRVEFLALSLWESLDALKTLTGPDIDKATGKELLNPAPMVKNYEVVVSALGPGCGR